METINKSIKLGVEYTLIVGIALALYGVLRAVL